MKHAGPDALDALEPALAELRKLPGLREKTRGIFYRGSDAFLHFHEDPAGFFADLKRGGHFVRMPANTRKEVDGLIREARRILSG
jgi:hypothetical protein